MKVKNLFISGAFICSVLLYASSVIADTKPILTSKPYQKPQESKPLDTSLPKDIDSQLPELGDDSQTVLTPLEEQRIGIEIMRDVAVSDDVVQDIEVIDYVQGLGNRLAAASDDKSPFNFFVVQDPTINAFSMPGHVIGVHTGLLLATNSESELASVLGHEIGHETQHHLARMLAKQKNDTIKNIAGIAVALLVARANPQLTSGALATTGAAGVQRQLDYTREHEREADRVGLTIMVNAGFDPRAMPAFFTTLQRGTRFSEGSAPSFLRTHPLTTERIADVDNRVETMPYKQVPDSLNFQLIRAKLRANSGLAQTQVDEFKDNIKEGRFANEVAEHYGLAIALLRKNDTVGSSNQLKWLRANAPKNPLIENLAARIEVANNNPKSAATQYAAGLNLFPTHRALIYGYADHFLAIKQPDKAIQLVQSKQSLFPNDAYFYEILAKAYTAKGKNLLSYQAQSESYFRKYNLAKAIEQMELAAKAKDGSFYEQSIVEARLKELHRLQENEKPVT
jgi:predicted Zn-dependent protease